MNNTDVLRATFVPLSGSSASQEATRGFSSHQQAAGAHDHVFDHQTTGTRKQGEAVCAREIGESVVWVGGAVGQVGHPALGGGDEERKGDDRHAKGEQSAEHTHARAPDAQEDERADGANHQSQADGEDIGAVFLMPLDVVGLHLALFVHVHLIFLHGLAFVVDRGLRRIVIEEAHERTVADKRNDAVGFVLANLESADPSHDQKDGDAEISEEMAFEGDEDPGREGEELVDH